MALKECNDKAFKFFTKKSLLSIDTSAQKGSAHEHGVFGENQVLTALQNLFEDLPSTPQNIIERNSAVKKEVIAKLIFETVGVPFSATVYSAKTKLIILFYIP